MSILFCFLKKKKEGQQQPVSAPKKDRKSVNYTAEDMIMIDDDDDIIGVWTSDEDNDIPEIEQIDAARQQPSAQFKKVNYLIISSLKH